MKKELVLASASPRRRELLEQLGLSFSVRVADIDESRLPGETPEMLVQRLAAGKAKAAFRTGEVVVAADTVVAVDGTVLGKPKDADDAVRMLKMLSGRSHFVYTGICVFDGVTTVSETVATEVTFIPMSDEEIHRYIASGEPLDKAGAYGIQGLAARYISGIRGDHYNVVGLPVCRLSNVLKNSFSFDF